MLITFEGIEGVGKTTQIELLCEELKRKGLPFLKVREPGGTQLSEKLREILLFSPFSLGAESELLLFEASRAELVRNVIIPALLQDKIVICDRFIDSTVAYQGYGRGIPLSIINKLNSFVTKGIKINRTYLLDNNLDIMEKRSFMKNKDRIESEDLNFHKRVKKGFLALAKKYSERILLIDSSKEIMEIHKIILDDFLKLL